MTLSEDVRRTDDVPIDPVDHPQWKGAHVRPMSAKALGQFLKMTKRDDDEDELSTEENLHAAAFMTTHCLCDELGVRVFTDAEVDWVESNKTMELLEPIAQAAAKLHGLIGDDEDSKAKN